MGEAMEKVELVFQVSCFQLRESALYVIIPAYLKRGKKDLFYQFELHQKGWVLIEILYDNVEEFNRCTFLEMHKLK